MSNRWHIRKSHTIPGWFATNDTHALQFDSWAAALSFVDTVERAKTATRLTQRIAKTLEATR